MIENWKKAYKFAVMWVLLAIGSLAGLEQFLPALEGKIPPITYAALVILGAIARLWKQRSLQTPESIARELEKAREVWDEAVRESEKAKK